MLALIGGVIVGIGVGAGIGAGTASPLSAIDPVASSHPEVFIFIVRNSINSILFCLI